ncbi:Protachykinin-1 [Heterocephalus glaber]|uniref:Protachykinin-1 n=1 Tax=Heterocephalus glaber TaxID=10181 RepID=G5BLD5_HETGA|nr:Protachykinin-1 [Heterocephalus glaber]
MNLKGASNTHSFSSHIAKRRHVNKSQNQTSRSPKATVKGNKMEYCDTQPIGHPKLATKEDLEKVKSEIVSQITADIVHIKSNMKILVVLAVFFLVSTQLFAEEIGANDDLNYWSDWSDSDQIKEELPEPFEHLLQRIARRPKPQQFFGLMGKREADSSIEKQVALLKALYGHGQISHKRHKTDSFVGLMGKRALNSGMYKTMTENSISNLLLLFYKA